MCEMIENHHLSPEITDNHLQRTWLADEEWYVSSLRPTAVSFVNTRGRWTFYLGSLTQWILLGVDLELQPYRTRHPCEVRRRFVLKVSIRPRYQTRLLHPSYPGIRTWLHGS